MILWLDDIRQPWKHGYIVFEWVKTAREAINLLKTGNITFASLDHDLSEEHYPWNCKDISECKGTGYDVVCFLEENPEYWPPDGVRVHSANPAGRARMIQVIEKFYGRNFQFGI